MRPFNLKAFVPMLLVFGACSTKPITALDAAVEPNNPSVVSIYTNQLLSDSWVTQTDKTCLSIVNEQVPGESNQALHIVWNKQAEVGCPWLGLGFGWDNWAAKDLIDMEKTYCLAFQVKSNGASWKTMPWAIGIEDYMGVQAYIGVVEKYVVGKEIGKEWTTLRIPLTEFTFNEWGLSTGSVKQLIFQFEASGDVYLDNIRFEKL